MRRMRPKGSHGEVHVSGAGNCGQKQGGAGVSTQSTMREPTSGITGSCFRVAVGFGGPGSSGSRASTPSPSGCLLVPCASCVRACVCARVRVRPRCDTPQNNRLRARGLRTEIAQEKRMQAHGVAVALSCNATAAGAPEGTQHRRWVGLHVLGASRRARRQKRVHAGAHGACLFSRPR
jgi:hypothetical protein